jgi:hypothetical protein
MTTVVPLSWVLPLITIIIKEASNGQFSGDFQQYLKTIPKENFEKRFHENAGLGRPPDTSFLSYQ